MRGLLAAVAFAALAAPAGAEAPPPLALERVLASLSSYPPLEAARLELEAARGELLAARGLFDPSWRTRAATVPWGYYPQSRLDSQLEQPTTLWGATVFGGYRLGRGSFAPYDGKLETNALGEWRAGVALPLWRNGPIDRRRATLAKAELGVVSAEAALAAERLGVARQAAHRYWGWAAAGRRLGVAEDLLDTARRRDADLERSVKAGATAPIERLENQRAIFQREAMRVAAEQSLRLAAIELSLVWRGPDGSPLIPAPEALPAAIPLPAAPGPADMQAALARRPELLRLQAQIEQAEVERKLADNQLAPGVDLAVVGSQDRGAGSPTREPGELEAVVSIELPLLNRAPRGRLAAAAAARDRLVAQRRFQEDRVRAEVQQAHAELAGALARAAIADRELALAQRLEGLERERFKLGEGTMLIVNLREQATAEAAMRAIEARAEAQRALASYRAATGASPGG